MKFSVGYQLPGVKSFGFMEAIEKYHDSIAEVYFPWTDFPTCRAPLGMWEGYDSLTAKKILEDNLSALKKMGIKLDVLFNANCYGEQSISKKLANRVISIIEHLNEIIGGVEIVTTTSPAIAHVIRSRFPDIELRASVNMCIGSVKGLEYIADLFDSFHIQREYNRDLERIKRLKKWTDANSKKLIMLANSGCMRNCSGQIFHDNLVSHETEIANMENLKNWNPHTCWRFLKNRENWVSILQNTWIRPEDLQNYDKLFDVVKLATRMHTAPGMVIGAYAKGKYRGNLLDLFEPGFGPALKPWFIDNEMFPQDWFEKTSNCSKQCENCNYCKKVFNSVLRNNDDYSSH
jgi:collagenase-like PrtC family protease